jgi:site-specific recombinase XerD
MLDRYYAAPAAMARLRVGPFGPHIDTFAGLLWKQGYSRLAAREKIRVVAALSRWLDERQIPLADLDEERGVEFLQQRGKRLCIRHGDRKALRDVLRQLRESGVVPARVSIIEKSSLHHVESAYAQYLLRERGLQPATVKNYLIEVRRFLRAAFGAGAIRFKRLHLPEITRFILHATRTLSLRRVQLMVSALRSFLRFLYQRGEIATDLAASVPRVADWRLSGLPKILTREQVESLLRSCDRSTAAGLRDYAVLVLLARLGLRAGEVVHLELDDIDWEAGKMIIRGKSARCNELPIPQDVGQALTAYLRHGRPRCASRRVFVRLRAPYQGFTTSAAVRDVVHRAFARTGIRRKHAGAHLLRHSLATEMIRSGNSLAEIGEILRHQLPSTTEIYTKVDLPALRALALPWPGGAS